MISLEWLAGFFDGEGCVSIIKSKKRGVYRYTLQLTLTNTHLPTLLKIQEVFGGNLFSDKPDKENWRTRHQLTWAKTEETQVLLNAIYPYTVTKKEQVKYLLDNWFKQVNPQSRKWLTPEQSQARLDMQTTLSQMKRIEYPANKSVN